jgi:hypothetical protein
MAHEISNLMSIFGHDASTLCAMLYAYFIEHRESSIENPVASYLTPACPP